MIFGHDTLPGRVDVVQTSATQAIVKAAREGGKVRLATKV